MVEEQKAIIIHVHVSTAIKVALVPRTYLTPADFIIMCFSITSRHDKHATLKLRCIYLEHADLLHKYIWDCKLDSVAFLTPSHPSQVVLLLSNDLGALDHVLAGTKCHTQLILEEGTHIHNNVACTIIFNYLIFKQCLLLHSYFTHVWLCTAIRGFICE